MKKIGSTELAILMLVVKLNTRAYGMEVTREYQRLYGENLVCGSIYSTLTRLVRKGVLSSKMIQPEPVRGGKSKRVYFLTPAGKQIALKKLEFLAAQIEIAKNEGLYD